MSTLDTSIVNRQWASRPDDERFVNLPSLLDHVAYQKAHSRSVVVSSRSLEAQPCSDGRGLQLIGPNGGAVIPTHAAFGQLATLAGAPAGYLRSLPAALAADNLNYGLKVEREAQDMGALLYRNGGPAMLRAATGPTYGRIWNADLVAPLVERFGDGINGQFRVPGEFGKRVEITKANTTLYAGDRDMFVFLADEENRITVPNRRNGEAGSLARGFYIANSETGNSTLIFGTLLFDYLCANRTIWGGTQHHEIRIRHSAKAPDRWLDEVQPVIQAYIGSSASVEEARIVAAQSRKVENLEAFMKGRKFTGTQVRGAIAAHQLEEGRPMESLWDVAVGVTAYAKSIPWMNDRVAVERMAGQVLQLAA